MLTGLVQGTTYHYRLGATDPSGNPAAKTGDLTFTTASGPVPVGRVALAVLAVGLGPVRLVPALRRRRRRLAPARGADGRGGARRLTSRGSNGGELRYEPPPSRSAPASP